MKKLRLSRRLLNAIVEMAWFVEADGVNNFQGHTSQTEREKAFNACLEAGEWAQYELRRRKIDCKRRNANKKARAREQAANPEGWQSVD